jgi:hypothetical protein
LVTLACVAATSVAQQSPADSQTLDEVTVAGPKDRERQRGPRVDLANPNSLMVKLDGTVNVQLRVPQAQPQVVFRRKSNSRQLPGDENGLSRVNRASRLELLPDRLIAAKAPWLAEAWFMVAANIDEADGIPAHISFGTNVALLNLDYVGLRDANRKARIGLENAMHPQTKECEAIQWIGDLWPDGTNAYVLIGKSRRDCLRVTRAREGDMLFAEDIPDDLRQAIRELYDPIASRLANHLGSEPGNMFIASEPGSTRASFQLQVGWNRNSLLLLHGIRWQQGIDVVQQASLRVAFMREQILRRIREADWPGPFTQAAASYLLLLARGEDNHTTEQLLMQELPSWIGACARRIRQVGGMGTPKPDVSSIECGLVLQFTYDAVMRFRSEGKQNAFTLWRKLLDESFRRGKSGVTPEAFLASSGDAQRIAQGLLGGSIDWEAFTAALTGVGVNLQMVGDRAAPNFELQSLQHFPE